MSTDESALEGLGRIASSRSRHKIFGRLFQSRASFSDLQRQFTMTSGNLTYHLNRLELNGYVRKLANGSYELTKEGKAIGELFQKIKSEETQEE